MSDDIISVEHVSKRYRLHHQTGERYTALRDVLMEKVKRVFGGGPREAAPEDEEDFWALNDVSFTVKRGEVVGIIGRNGAGKSTLLKILSRITEPTCGRITLRGRVASLLEVGTGFHPELTGRENIFLNGAILGMSRADVRHKFDEIVAFAEVEKFLDTPVKRYSSGMYVRLAFAVAAHLEPEILIVDEVLAVGDAEFQRKCLGKMQDVTSKEGRTVLFVSHNLTSIEQLCSSGVLLQSGRVEFRGAIRDSIRRYMESISSLATTDLASRVDREGNGQLRILGISLHDEFGQNCGSAAVGKPIVVRLHYCSYLEGEYLVDAAFNLKNRNGSTVTTFANTQSGPKRLHIHPAGYFECKWPKVNLCADIYSGNIFISVNHSVCDWIQNAFDFEINEGDYFRTGQLLPRENGAVFSEQVWKSHPTLESKPSNYYR